MITVRPALVGLYAHRLAAIMPAYMEPLYPYRIWQDRIELTKMYYLGPNNPDSTIIAMLGRFKNVAESP